MSCTQSYRKECLYRHYDRTSLLCGHSYSHVLCESSLEENVENTYYSPGAMSAH